MRVILSFLAVALFSVGTFGNITADQEYLLNHAGAVQQKVGLGSLIQKTRNLLVAKYSFAVQGGATTADINLLTNLSDVKSLAQLPSKAVVTNAWVEVVSAVTSTGSATVKINAASSGDILASQAKAILTTGRFIQGVPTGATTTFIKLATFASGASTVKLTAGTSTLTAGKINAYIEYVLGD